MIIIVVFFWFIAIEQEETRSKVKSQWVYWSLNAVCCLHAWLLIEIKARQTMVQHMWEINVVCFYEFISWKLRSLICYIQSDTFVDILFDKLFSSTSSYAE